MTQTKPRYVGGEPVCSGQECPRWGFGNTADPHNRTCFHMDDPCVPALRAEIDRLRGRCAWKEDEDCWRTGCGNAHIFETGTPSDNEHVFCPYCGKRLVEERYSGQNQD